MGLRQRGSGHLVRYLVHRRPAVPAVRAAPRHRRRPDHPEGVTMTATSLSHSRRRPFSWGNPLTFVLALAVAAVSFSPVVYVILGGFRTTGQLAADPAGL